MPHKYWSFLWLSLLYLGLRVSNTFFDCAVWEFLAADDSRVKVELEHHTVLYTVFLHEFDFAFFGIHVHTSELIHLEHLSVLSDTGLLEEDLPR